MIIKFDFGDEHIQYISCATKVGRKINKTRKDFENWIFDENKNKMYWSYENEEKYCPNYDSDAIIDWLNNVKFKKGTAKAKINHGAKIKSEKDIIFLANFSCSSIFSYRAQELNKKWAAVVHIFIS